jgi:WhiB family redox-sensing transcriptional regulator
MTQRSTLSIIDIPIFMENAKPSCAEVDPELFFPQEVEVSSTKIVSVYRDASAAKEICYSCPLVAECLEYALGGQEIGIWGGLTERQRDKLRKRRNYSPIG